MTKQEFMDLWGPRVACGSCHDPELLQTHLIMVVEAERERCAKVVLDRGYCVCGEEGCQDPAFRTAQLIREGK